MTAKKNNTYIITSILFLATVLRFFNLGKKSLWIDEQWTHVISEKSIPGIIKYLKIMADRPPLHLILTHLSLLFGNNEFFLRLVPAIFGIACIAGIYVLGKTFFSEKEAKISAFLLAISSYQISYSQDAGAYTIFLFFSILSTYLFFHALKKDKWTLWAGFSLTSALCLYSSYFGIFLVASYGMIALTIWLSCFFLESTKDSKDTEQWAINLLLIDNKIFIRFLAAFICIVLLFLPWAPVLYSALTKYKGTTATMWTKITPSMLLLIAEDFSGNNLFIIFSLLFLFGLFKDSKNNTTEYLTIFWCTTTPFLIVTILKPQYNFFSRYVIFILYFFIIGIAKGLTGLSKTISSKFKIKPSYVAGFILIGITIQSGINLQKHYNSESRNWRSLASLIKKEAKTGDLIAIEPNYLYYPFFYYFDIDHKRKMTLIDPLTSAKIVTIPLEGSRKISVTYIDKAKKPGLLRKYKRFWYISSEKPPPEWVTTKLTFIKNIPGKSKGWDLNIYRTDLKKKK